jgi:hypothetical protein
VVARETHYICEGVIAGLNVNFESYVAGDLAGIGPDREADLEWEARELWECCRSYGVVAGIGLEVHCASIEEIF